MDNWCPNCGNLDSVSIIHESKESSWLDQKAIIDDEYSYCGKCKEEWYTSTQSSIHTHKILTAIYNKLNTNSNNEEDAYPYKYKIMNHLIRLLSGYADHKAWCNIMPGKDCDCGLDFFKEVVKEYRIHKRKDDNYS